MAATSKRTSKKPPWEKASPTKAGKKPPTHLSSAEKQEAAAAAHQAGRRYPNLVDNMHVARRKKKASKSDA